MRKFNEVNYIRPEFTSVSKETGDYINYTLEYGLFDISDRPNKHQNYFSCCMLPIIKSPFIIGCFHSNDLEANSRRIIFTHLMQISFEY